MMRIAIRLDDITPAMRWDRFERFRALLDAHDLKPLIGVVPDCRDASLALDVPAKDFRERILALKDAGWIIAMHGLTHIYATKDGGLFPLNRNSEFAGLPYEKQRQMIAEGKQILSSYGIETDIFMAPSHSYDRATLRALKAEGFRYVTDGFGDAPYEREGLIFLPIAVQKARALSSAGDGTVTFVVHTNTMNEAEYAFYEKLLADGRAVSFSDILPSSAPAQTPVARVKENLTARTKRMFVNFRQSRQE